MTMTTQWNAQLYDTNHTFVSQYGTQLIELLNPQPKEHILDLGCGTGDLAHTLSNMGANVTGIDYSADMIHCAKEKYPHISFHQKDARKLTYEKQFDAVFSNATLHWIKEPQQVVQQIYQALKVRGRFVAEFGGAFNVHQITNALIQQITEAGIPFSAQDFPWYFPTIGEYTTLLEQEGFEVQMALYFSRPTPLEGDNGMRNWLEMFSSHLFNPEQNSIKKIIFERTLQQLKPQLYSKDGWVADYKRLRILAIK